MLGFVKIGPAAGMLNYIRSVPMDTAPDSASPEVTHRRRRASCMATYTQVGEDQPRICLGLLAISLVLQDRIMDLAKSRHESAASRAAEARMPRST